MKPNDKRRREPIIEGNPTLDNIAHRVQAKVRALTRERDGLLKKAGALDGKIAEAEVALADLKRASSPA